MAAEREDFTEYDYYSEAKVLEEKGEDEKALEAYQKAVELDPEYAEAWFYKAKLHHKLGQKKEAIECAKKALEIEPDWEDHVQEFLPDLSA
ncbi:MAG: tetratricopeptide repeat protein [Candidatus Lokiarchaeota archaeon]|jgi:tetratricopeptide (TPR) repeat protein|nr:tetratricopeptide repeat protein [Candidatus Lokiarchaeota archaeon]